MTENIKTRWTAALRSGEYPQAKGSLCTFFESGEPSGYCCLGVLQKIQGAEFTDKALDIQPVYGETIEGYLNTEENLSGVTHYPDVTALRILPNMNDGTIIYRHETNDYDKTYDNNPQSFKQIADWIDENLDDDLRYKG